MCTKLQGYFTRFNHLTGKQAGYRVGFSSETALVSFTDKIKSESDSHIFSRRINKF